MNNCNSVENERKRKRVREREREKREVDVMDVHWLWSNESRR